MIDISKIDFKTGKVVFCEMDYKKEDMLMVEYEHDIILDLGWYTRVYGIKIVKDKEWVPPFYMVTCSTEKAAKELLVDAIDRVEAELERIRTEENDKKL